MFLNVVLVKAFVWTGIPWIFYNAVNVNANQVIKEDDTEVGAFGPVVSVVIALSTKSYL